MKLTEDDKWRTVTIRTDSKDFLMTVGEILENREKAQKWKFWEEECKNRFDSDIITELNRPRSKPIYETRQAPEKKRPTLKEQELEQENKQLREEIMKK